MCVCMCVHTRVFLCTSPCVCLIAQSCLTLCDLMDCSLPGLFVHGIFQARIQEGVAIYFYRASSPGPGIKPSSLSSPALAGSFFTATTTWETNAGDIRDTGLTLEEGIATHSSILAWEIPWTEEPGRLQSMRSQTVRHNLSTECASVGLVDISWV